MEVYKSGWSAPSNIALVKYWGKRPVQLPASPSLSFTLDKARTETQVTFTPGKEAGFSLTINNERSAAFDTKVGTFFERASKELDFIDFGFFDIESRNTFPHAAGIASSASGMSALSLCLCSIEARMKQQEYDEAFLMKASRLARLGSGSACRSVFSPVAVWGNHLDIPGSHDEFAVRVNSDQVHPVFRDYHNAILVVNKKEKAVSSSTGHALMEDHPYLQGRLAQAEQNMSSMLRILNEGDLEKFTEIVEEEALSLHALMMSSRPGFMLLNPATLQIIEKIRYFRNETGLHPAFTLDAGPNVHLLYPARERDTILDFIRLELSGHCEDGFWIDDRVGAGPEELKS